MDLGFTLGPSDQSTVHSFTNNNSRGVGVNAATGVNVSDVACDPLFELVWCPNKGLSLKCADYILNKNSSNLRCDVEQSNMLLSPHHKPINESNLNDTQIIFQGYFEASNDGKSTDQENQRTTDKSNPPSLLIGHSKLTPDFDKSENNSSPIAVLQEKLDSALENNGKEKEQTLFHRESNEKTTKYDDDDNDDDSRESIESCSRVGFSSKENKRVRLEQNLIGGSKRIKEKVQESPFMNWIANMMKGVRHPNQNYDDKIITSNKTGNAKSKNTGFENVFESFNSRNTSTHERRIFGDSVICNTKKNPEICTGGVTEAIQKPKVRFCWNKISDGPKEMFDAISKLRLSRTDILRWKNSQIPISNLDGFFVRLRLGKFEGFGETRYYVASINGIEREDSAKDSKNTVCVSVWGMNCVVESQYVSNHEDELTAWWEISGKVPEEGDLKSRERS